MRRYAMVVMVVLAALWVGRATADEFRKSYAGGMAMIGVAQITDYVVEVDGSTATVRGTVTNTSDAVLRGITVTVWDNEFVEAQIGTLLPGESRDFVAVMQGGPNWAWYASITADVQAGVYGAALPSAGR